ncbi:MAG: LPS export ABC transporter periplasmic protein LptC [Bacteroidetes bacterium]|nr:LPS export ABC transporter periplasmic protein LptC [Bacteroidota bacterium]
MKKFSPLFFLLCFTAALHAQQEPVILENANIFSGKRLENGEDIRQLDGNVKFRQGNVRVWCDKAVQFLRSNEIELMGNVKVVRDTVTLTARKGRYFGNEKIAACEGAVKLQSKGVTIYSEFATYFTEQKRAEFQKNVRVVDSTSVIYSDRLTYHEKERKSIAVSNVRIINPSDNITMFGEYLEHFDSTRYSKMTQNPRLMQIDTSANGEIDTLAVKSIVMESFDDSSKKLLATDSVMIARGNLSARCGFVRFLRAADRIELYTSPVVWYNENQVTGDTILLYLEKNRLKKAFIKTRAFVLSQSDSNSADRYNQLSGRMIELTFKNNKLQETKVERNATSLYFLYDDNEPNGANKISGDYITMTFDAGKPNTIYVRSGIEGQYYPENVVLQDVKKYNLDGFFLQENRPTFYTVFPKKENARSNK